MPKSSGINRDVGLNHPGVGAGKGSADRSPGWREKYNDIDWGNSADDIAGSHEYNMTGFEHKGPGRFRKTYGQPSPVLVEVNTSTTDVECCQGNCGCNEQTVV